MSSQVLAGLGSSDTLLLLISLSDSRPDRGFSGVMTYHVWRYIRYNGFRPRRLKHCRITTAVASHNSNRLDCSGLPMTCSAGTWTVTL